MAAEITTERLFAAVRRLVADVEDCALYALILTAEASQAVQKGGNADV